jgi:predicted DNA-binding transcriptional regulator YafY
VTEAGRGRLGRRLGRILVMLPYIIANPGVTVSELTAKFGAKRRDLIDDLNLVFMCGLPGYGPGDLIEVAIEGDRVYVDMADYFKEPLRITPAEALALYGGGAALSSLPGMEQADALERALAKLGRALGVDGSGAPAGIEIQMESGPRHLEQLQRALSERKRTRIEYLSATTGRLTERIVDPWALLAALGHWYLVAWDLSRHDERMFRADRIKQVELLEQDAEVPPDFDPERYRGAFGGRGGTVVTLEISPSAARWFEDYYPVRSSAELPDGWTRVELVSGGDRWAATLLMRLASDARAVEPERVLEEARGLAGAIAARYR